MNWSCEEVVQWCKSFIDDDSILSKFTGQVAFVVSEMRECYEID